MSQWPGPLCLGRVTRGEGAVSTEAGGELTQPCGQDAEQVRAWLQGLKWQWEVLGDEAESPERGGGCDHRNEVSLFVCLFVH